MSFSINPPNPDEIHPTTFTPRPGLAPNPLGPVPQDFPFAGMRAPGDNGTEHPISAEFLGAQHMITAGRPCGMAPPTSLWDGTPGGHIMPPSVPRMGPLGE